MELKQFVRTSPLGPPAMRLVAWMAVKRRGGMSADEAVQVLGSLDASGMKWWLAGGWGVDALLGRQGRAHADVDVILDAVQDDETRARDALSADGYRVVEERVVPGLWMPRTLTLDHPQGGQVQLVTLDRSLVSSALGLLDRAEGSSDDALFRDGQIAGRTVPCLAPVVQLLLHGGYPARRQDRFDMARLARRFPDALQALTASGAPANDVAARVMMANLTYQHDLAIAVWRETEECKEWIAAGRSPDESGAPGRPEMPRHVSDSLFGQLDVHPG